mmetsp:Transcript_95672/g.172613  ORF Transcript_95672/g.172613 Transcript_95672/m.172613 type:complete len:194 (+) Transcript_95672:119-700(+)
MIYDVGAPLFQHFLAKRKAVKENQIESMDLTEDLKEPKGMNELASAAWRGDVSAVRTLVENGADIESTDAAGRTTLALAAVEGKCEVVRFLVEKGANLEATDSGGLTALLWASLSGRVEEVQVLLEAGADFELADQDGMTALKLAAVFNKTEVARLLVEKGADPQPALALALKFQKRSAETARYLASQVVQSR